MLAPYDLLLALHVIAGSLGLILGPVAIWASRRGELAGGAHSAYHCSVLAVCVTASGLVALDFRGLWWLLLLAGLSYALALLGFLAPRRRWCGWVGAYARGQGGSYIALVTASLVVSVEGSAAVAAWVLPTLVGHPLIERRVARLEAREHAERSRATGNRALVARNGA